MTDLRHLMDHPPREPSPPPKPAFTAQVMRRVRGQAAAAVAGAPTPQATGVRGAPVWAWWAIGVAGAIVLTALIPADLALGGIQADLGSLAGDVVGGIGELLLATAMVSVAALAAVLPARLRGGHG